MDPASREKIWRRAMIILAIAALLISACALYGIKRLEAESKVRVHLIREVNRFTIDPHHTKQPPK